MPFLHFLLQLLAELDRFLQLLLEEVYVDCQYYHQKGEEDGHFNVVVEQSGDVHPDYQGQDQPEAEEH